MIGAGIASRYALPGGAQEAFDRFHALLTEWNGRMDLTAATEPEEALYRHYLDSLSGAGLIPEGARVVDIGTGAGFPGVPIALLRPDVHMTLLDALQKRVAFLRAVIGEVPVPNAEAVHARAEDYARVEREAFDVAVSRAVGSLPALLEWALPLTRVGGCCIFWKGPGAMAELAEARRVALLIGGGEVRVVPAAIPGRDWSHVLVVAEKKAPTDGRFPRRAGMALKRPL